MLVMHIQFHDRPKISQIKIHNHMYRISVEVFERHLLNFAILMILGLLSFLLVYSNMFITEISKQLVVIACKN